MAEEKISEMPVHEGDINGFYAAGIVAGQNKRVDLGRAFYFNIVYAIRVTVTVSTYAEALTRATGPQYKEIKVLSDETDGNAVNNRYLYDGVEGVLELIF